MKHKGAWDNHGHKRGCIGTMEDASTIPQEEQGSWDEDHRVEVGPYFINYDYNFVDGGNYSQIVIADGDTMSFIEAMDKATGEAEDRGAYGFFYQQH